MTVEEACRNAIYEQAARSILSGETLTWTPTPELCAAFRRLMDQSRKQQT